MKVWKKLTALLLCAACVLALAVVSVPAAAAETVSTFPDITDPQVGRAVEALRMMGVVSGSGGLYEPNGNLTRAQFCKMAILVMGKGDEADAQANRTIFNDVPGNHWARGYVNLAATMDLNNGAEGEGVSRLMMGLGNGNFAPDRNITYAEAVTTLLRILGYAQQANLNWPNGAVSTAAAVGLSDGLTTPRANDPITRGQAAIIFCNMLTAHPFESENTFAASLGSVKENMLLVSCNAKTESGQYGGVRFASNQGLESAVLPAATVPSSSMLGLRGTAVFDKSGKFLTFLPNTGSSSKTITVASASAGVLTATDGVRYTPANSTHVLNGETPDTYANTYNSIQPGTSITLCFTDAGAIDYLFIHGTPTSLTGGVMVAKDRVSGNPFAQLTAGTTDYKIVKNGVEVSTSALRQYDVAAFDPSNKTLYVTDFRLTGVYESASPNTSMPTEITVFGKKLAVLDSAVNDLKNLRLNSTVTFLLSPDGKVAGAVSASTLRSNMVGYVVDSAPGSDTSAGTVTVKLLNAPTPARTDSGETLDLSEVKGNFSGNADNYADCLVTVTGTRSGNANRISLSRLSGRTSSDSLNTAARTLGNTPLADNVAVFDRIAGSCIAPVTMTSIAVDSVPASKIAYQRTNSAGEIDLLVLNDVTGDLYTYGIVKNGEVDGGSFGEGDNETQITNRTTTVINSKGENGDNSSLPVVGGTSYRNGQFIGLAASVSKLKGISRHAASILLKSVDEVSPANFNLTTGLFFSGSVELPIADDVQCYNAQTGTWFGANTENASPTDNLRACLAYSSDLTVYYDRDPGQGGKVRVVVAN